MKDENESGSRPTSLVQVPADALSRWYEERAHMETVLMQRFNYFIVFFGVVIVGALAMTDGFAQTVLFGVGATVTYLVALTLGRAQVRLGILVGAIEEHDQAGPLAQTTRAANRVSASQRHLIGHGIPWVCFTVLCAAFILTGLREADRVVRLEAEHQTIRLDLHLETDATE